MSGIDVRDLAQESLASGRFPVDSRADFRLFLAPDAHRGILEHAKQDVTVEICGVLVGRWERDDAGPFARVTNYIRCNNAASKMAEVTFTHESWAQINKEMDSRFANDRIIGWYHSHPDFGIFLSDRDCFIHEHFFSGPGQIAYVVDPVRDLEGVFAWQAGKPQPMTHYWIGDQVRTVEASRRKPGGDAGKSGRSLSEADTVASRPVDRGPGFAMTLLTMLCAFLLGYLYSGLLNRWQQSTLEQGAVARFGAMKVLKYGLDDKIKVVHDALAELTTNLRKLPETNEALSEDQRKAAEVSRKQIFEGLDQCQQVLARLHEEYSLSNSERSALAMLVAQIQSEMRSPAMMPSEKPKKDVASANSGDSESAGQKTNAAMKDSAPVPAAGLEIKQPTTQEK